MEERVPRRAEQLARRSRGAGRASEASNGQPGWMERGRTASLQGPGADASLPSSPVSAPAGGGGCGGAPALSLRRRGRGLRVRRGALVGPRVPGRGDEAARRWQQQTGERFGRREPALRLLASGIFPGRAESGPDGASPPGAALWAPG